MSRGPIVVLVVLVLIVAAVFGWFALRDRIVNEGEQAAKACVEGPATLAVTADPDIVDAVRTVAAAYDATAPVVRDHCVSTAVTSTPSAAVAQALASENYDESQAGPRPSLWIPTSSGDAAEVVAARSVDSTPRSLATSPVVLGVAPELADTLGGAAVGWADLPRLATQSQSLDAIGATGWGSLRPALPASPSTTAAAEAIAAATADPAATGAPSAEQAASPAVVAAISQLSRAASSAASTPPADTDAALDAMVQAGDPAAAPVHAVPVTEQQLFGRISEGQQLAAFRPAGATPVADHPAVVLSGSDDTQRAAAAEFAEFARASDQHRTFLDRGFRIPAASGGTDTTPAPVAGLTFPAVGQPAAVTDPAARRAVLATLASPTRPSSTTVLLDVSGSMESLDGGSTRLANVTAALRGAIDSVPDVGRVGLWTYSRALDGPRPYRVEQPLGDLTADTRAALDASLSSLTPATATSTYASVQAAYASAVQNKGGDGIDSVLLITDGPNDDTSISSARFLQSIADASDPARPVRVDVVSLTDNSDIDTLRTLAQQTGGELVEVSSSDPTLAATLGRLSTDR